MDTLALRVPHKTPEARDEESPTGFVQLEQGAARGVLLTPDEIDPARSYPLITVLHGAGRQDEMLVKACRGEPERRQALFFVPRSVAPTWDLITGQGRADLDFLHYAYDLIYRRYPVAAEAQCLIGYSDGASYALSLGHCRADPSLRVISPAASLAPDALGCGRTLGWACGARPTGWPGPTSRASRSGRRPALDLRSTSPVPRVGRCLRASGDLLRLLKR
jgi:hypothetical protein